MGSNREKSNISIAILEKLPFLKGNKKIFRILRAAIIFSPTVYPIAKYPSGQVRQIFACIL